MKRQRNIENKLAHLKSVNWNIPNEWAVHFETSIRGESTRAKVVLSACYLDSLLRQLLKIVTKPIAAKEDPLFDGAIAPLGTMSARTEVAWRMGAIPDEVKKSLDLVRKIRNRFAHNLLSCTFEDEKIRHWNDQLNKLNDNATSERRLTFSPGPIGDFEKSVSWLIFWLNHVIQQVPVACPGCGTEMPYRASIKATKPTDGEQ